MLEQVTNGVSVRMAALYLLLAGAERTTADDTPATDVPAADRTAKENTR